MQRGWNKSVLSSFLLNTSWLRNSVLGQATECLPELQKTAASGSKLPFAITEAQSMCGGSFEPGAPTTYTQTNNSNAQHTLTANCTTRLSQLY